MIHPLSVSNKKAFEPLYELDSKRYFCCGLFQSDKTTWSDLEETLFKKYGFGLKVIFESMQLPQPMPAGSSPTVFGCIQFLERAKQICVNRQCPKLSKRVVAQIDNRQLAIEELPELSSAGTTNRACGSSFVQEEVTTLEQSTLVLSNLPNCPSPFDEESEIIDTYRSDSIKYIDVPAPAEVNSIGANRKKYSILTPVTEMSEEG